MLPEWAIERLVYWKFSSNNKQANQDQSSTEVEKVIPFAETDGDQSERQVVFDTSKAVEWQVQHHQGFIKSNISSLRHAPISGQHDYWTRMAKALGDQAPEQEAQSTANVLVICGKYDPIIVMDELRKDSDNAFEGQDSPIFQTIDAGHDFPITKSDEVLKVILNFWVGNT
ncbi:MAG: hypothetical protein Q9182_006528 [Xanthomendoza sp. 2 TL-2023]